MVTWLQILPEFPDEPPDGIDDYESTSAEKEALSKYPEWVVANLSPLAPDEFKTSDYTHLVSSGCLIFERRPWLDIKDVLSAQGERRLSLASSANYHGRLEELLWDAVDGSVLRHVWDSGLRDTILTPAGLLIGTAAHDVRNGVETPVNWAISKSALAGPPEDHVVWDGRHISDKFMDQLGREVRDLAERRVGIWRELKE